MKNPTEKKLVKILTTKSLIARNCSNAIYDSQALAADSFTLESQVTAGSLTKRKTTISLATKSLTMKHPTEKV